MNLFMSVIATVWSGRPFMSVLSALLGLLFAERLRFIALTGNIGCGKSTCMSFIKEHYAEVYVIDSDSIAREVVSKGSEGLKAVVREFGSEVVDASEEINRSKLGKLIFKEPYLRKRLNAILHPLIFRRIISDLFWRGLIGGRKIVADIPLLFESPWFIQILFYKKILVLCSTTSQIQRLLKRHPDQMKEALQQRIDSQMPPTLKIPLADVIWHNEDSINNLHSQIRNTFEFKD